MLISEASPVGITIPIQRLQQFLYPVLNKIWSTADSTYDCYGRIYKNQTDDGYSPEAYKGNSEFKEIFFDDNLKALSFFGIGDEVKYDHGNSTAKVFLIFMVDLKKLKPGNIVNPDEATRLDVEKICQDRRFGFEMTGFVTGFESVFKEYSGWKKTAGIKFRDTYPTHCFRINFDLLYDINECN